MFTTLLLIYIADISANIRFIAGITPFLIFGWFCARFAAIDITNKNERVIKRKARLAFRRIVLSKLSIATYIVCILLLLLVPKSTTIHIMNGMYTGASIMQNNTILDKTYKLLEKKLDVLLEEGK